MSTDREFLQAKTQRADGHGFEPGDLPVHLFEFQRELVEWATRQGRAAIFVDCGLGKTPRRRLPLNHPDHRRTEADDGSLPLPKRKDK